ncbi:hypothetical protein BY458DRAFT_549225 [Sporodiniella umbellata]|nr:hypothetical protein BY458DRAFT_549225 [Sporodiniella umbellata]
MNAESALRKNVTGYLYTAFSNLVDQFGHKQDITPALHRLTEVTMFYEDPRFDSCRFIGEGARAFTVRWVISSTYPNSDAKSLVAYNRKCMDVGMLAKNVFDRGQLKRVIGVAAHTRLLDLYAGVLVESFGMAAVRSFLEPAIRQALLDEIKKPSMSTLNPTPDVDPKQQLRQFLTTNGGEFKADMAETPDKYWEATVMCQLVATGTIFMHKRVGLSKQKATSAACFDIMQYLHNHQDVFSRLLMPNGDTTQAHLLPISPSDYSNSYVTPVALKKTEANTRALENHPNKAHWAQIPHSDDHEETLKQLSLLLLGNQENGKAPNQAQPGHFGVNTVSCQAQPSSTSNSFGFIKQETS